MNQKSFFTNVVKFGTLVENVSSKVKVKLSFGHKAFISSFSKLSKLSLSKLSKLSLSKLSNQKNFFYKILSLWCMLFKNVSQKGKVKLSWIRKAVISSQEYQRLISGISQTNLRHISKIY